MVHFSPAPEPAGLRPTIRECGQPPYVSGTPRILAKQLHVGQDPEPFCAHSA